MNLKNVEISIGLLSTNSSYLCLRRKKKPFCNYIEFPGGKKRTNETSIQCLKRELKEELNIEVLKFKYLSTIKHCYDDALIIINVFTIFRYKGNIKSNEHRDIVYFPGKYDFDKLPTHNRILNLRKIPRHLKILTIDNLNHENLSNMNLYRCIRLRDISFDVYKRDIKHLMEKYRYKGNIIIDYPHNIDWDDVHFGIHFKSNLLNEFIPNKKNEEYIYSASCHTLKDVEISNRKLFDFILLSPVLESKYSYDSIGWDKFSSLSLQSYVPTHALGGLCPGNTSLFDSIKNHGFGIAGIRF